MKNLFAIIIIFIGIGPIKAQILSSGNYTSSDGMLTVAISHEKNMIWLTSPSKTDEYKLRAGNVYYHTDPKYSGYYIRVTGTNKYYTGKSGGGEYLFNFSGENSSSSVELPLGIDNCPLYDKYLKLAQTDETEVQAWTFCGAAAFAKCTYNKLGVLEYITPIIKAMKYIVEDVSKCPCEDAITAQEWNSVSID